MRWGSYFTDQKRPKLGRQEACRVHVAQLGAEFKLL